VPDIVAGYDELIGLLPALLEVTEQISRDCGWRPATTSTQKGLPA
jgi:hypothetical protein